MSQTASIPVETLPLAFDHTPLPEGWRWVKLGDVAEYINGRAFKPEDWGTSGLPIIRIQNLNSPDAAFNYFSGTVEPRYIVNDGDLLISWSASLDAFIWNRGKAILNQHIFKVIENSDIIRKDFFYFVARETMSEIRSLVHGATMKHITKPEFERIEIPLPPLPEQKRIATILKEQMAVVERARAAAEAQLKAAKDLPNAYLREVFESSEAQQWQEKKIGEICAVTKLAGFEYTKYVKYVPDGEYVALRAQNVRNEGLDLRSVVRISREVASVLYRSKLDKHDVVMTFIGANIGEATWIDQSDTFYCAPNIAKITPNPESVDYRYLTLAIHSRPFQQQIKEINASTAQQSLSMRDIRNFTLPVPLLERQRNIAARLLEYRLSAKLLREKLQEQLDAIYPLPATLLRQAFTGKL